MTETVSTPIPAPWAIKSQTEAAPVTAETENTNEPKSEEALQPQTEAAPVTAEGVVMVTVTVPKAFKLRLDDYNEIAIRAGVQEMSLEQADHWFSKVNGVEVYTPSK